MILVLIVGSGAVGKMTVGKALSEATGLRLFHNHMMIEPVLSIFGGYDGKTVGELREVIFRNFLESEEKGMIFTYMCAFDQPSDVAYLQHVSSLFEEKGGEVYFVELVADQKVRLQRNRTEERKAAKASKRDSDFAESLILSEDSRFRLESLPGEVPYKNYLKIDNTKLTPEECVSLIREKFAL